MPCAFWLATTYAKVGRAEQAEAILARAEEVAGRLGLFAEEVDPRTSTFLGISPWLFSQVEYVGAVIEMAKASPLGIARMAPGEIVKRVGWGFERSGE